MIAATVLAIVLLTQTASVDGLSLAEVPAYAAALKNPDSHRPTPVTFRQLWSDPKSYRGRIVEVSGRVARVFQAPARGELPPRVEVWIDQGENLLCVVVPDRLVSDQLARPGRFLSVSGTSLGLVRYSGGDVERLAPLIVGPGPVRLVKEETSLLDRTNWSASTWGSIATGSLLVGGFLAWAHSRRPRGPRLPTVDGVEFLS